LCTCVRERGRARKRELVRARRPSGRHDASDAKVTDAATHLVQLILDDGRVSCKRCELLRGELVAARGIHPAVVVQNVASPPLLESELARRRPL